MRDEVILRHKFHTVLSAYKKAFPNITPPTTEWWSLWLQKHEVADVLVAIHNLSKHPLRDSFTQDSTGRAITASLRNIVVRRALTLPADTGVQS